MTVQIRNAELVGLLNGDFQHRNEANFAWRAHAAHLAIPGLRGYWPISAFNSVGAVWDQSGNGRQLTNNGDPKFSAYDLAPYIILDGAGDYLSRADEAGLRVTGLETYVLTARRGIALGGWFYSSSLGATQGLITKWGAQRAYSLELNPAGSISARLSDDGTYGVGHHDDITSSNTIGADEWFWAAFTWSGTGASTSMSIWLNGTRTDGVPTLAQIFIANADFVIGGFHGGASLLTGYASMCWLSAMCITPDPDEDTLGFSLYQQMRRLFYV